MSWCVNIGTLHPEKVLWLLECAGRMGGEHKLTLPQELQTLKRVLRSWQLPKCQSSIVSLTLLSNAGAMQNDCIIWTQNHHERINLRGMYRCHSSQVNALVHLNDLENGRGMQNPGGIHKGYRRVGVRLQLFIPLLYPHLWAGYAGVHEGMVQFLTLYGTTLHAEYNVLTEMCATCMILQSNFSAIICS
jgi:hypothetical protein